MVIFHTDHWGAVAHFITLAVNKHWQEEKILIYTENDKYKYEIAERWVLCKLFNKVIFSNKIQHPGDKLHDKKLIHETILNTIDDVLNENGINIQNATKIYSTTDIDGVFRYYLASKEKHYDIIMLSVRDIYEEYKNRELYEIGDVTKEYMQLLYENHIYDGESIYCDNIFAFPETPYDNDKIINKIIIYDLKNEIEKIPASIGAEILKSFNISIKELNRVKYILLSNSGGFLWRSITEAGFDAKDLTQQVLIYQELIDFYSKSVNGRLIIKAHPNNGIEWSKYFNGVPELNKNMPIEFIRLAKKCHIKQAIALQTSAIDKICDKIDNVVLATVDLAKYYSRIFALFTACMLYKSMDYEMPIIEWGFSAVFFESYMHFCMRDCIHYWDSAPNNTYESTCFTIYRNLTAMEISDTVRFLDSMDAESVLVLLNISSDIPFYRLLQNKKINLNVIKISKKALRENIVAPIVNEYIYVFSKSKLQRNKIENFRYKKQLLFSGIEIQGVSLTSYEQDIFLNNLTINSDISIFNKILNVLLDCGYVSETKNSLKEIKDFGEYLLRIKLISDSIVFIVVKDNAGKNFTSPILKLWGTIGGKIQIEKLGWNSYICIINNNKIIYEVAGVNEDPSEYSGMVEGLSVKIISQSYHKGNKAVVSINGVDYSVNGRGLNFVVFDKVASKVIDSVCFDTYDQALTCMRK